MSDLSFNERAKLEKLFGMSGGYVLEFTNRSFQDFIADSVGRDIYEDKYQYASGSKANLFRRFWELEPNYIVGKVLSDMIDLVEEDDLHNGNDVLLINCRKIAARLLQGAPVESIDAIGDNLSDNGFELLVTSIRKSIDENEPEQGLDRLHTFLVKYLRHVGTQRGIPTDRSKPLHSLMGEYVKALERAGELDSEMSKRILKSSISVFESFNTVRNEQSLAHDNQVLNYDECLLIFGHVTSLVRFIQALERRSGDAVEEHEAEEDDGLPF